MDFFGILDVPLWIILGCMSIILLYIYGTYPRTIWKRLGIPAPPSAPFIGNMYQIYNPQTGMRASIDKWSKEYGKIFGILFFRDPTLVVLDIDSLKDILVKDFNNYVDRYFIGYDYLWQPIMKKGLFFNMGQDWKRIRRIITPSFSSSKLKLLTHYMNTTSQQLAHTLHQHMENGTEPDAKAVFSAFSLDVLAGTAFGLELNSQNNAEDSFYLHAKGMVTFTSSLKIILGTVGLFPFLGWIVRLLNIGFLNTEDVLFFEDQIRKLVFERKANPDESRPVDFLQFLINAEADEIDNIEGSKKLTVDEIVAQGIVFIIAGYETTSATLQWLSFEVARNPDVQQKIVEEIEEVLGEEKEVNNAHCQQLKYMDAVINETLRMYPPVITLSRLAGKSTVVKGYPVPAGTAIFIPVYNLGRDPELFEDPDTFNPNRFLDGQKSSFNPISFLPFGFGPRQCIGLRLAMLEMKIALVHMLRAVSIESTNPREADIDDFSGLLVPKVPIKLNLSKRHA